MINLKVHTREIARLEEEVKKYIAVGFDEELKRAYLEAVELVPDLVRKETPALAFLRRENWDPKGAARRLLKYWKYRREVFGERYLLPLTQSGSGALTRSTIELLQSGLFVLIPHEDRPSLFYTDLSLLRRPIARDTLPYVFYICTNCTDDALQTHGIVPVHITKPGHRVELLPNLWKIIIEAMPIKWHPVQIYVPVVEPGTECLQDYLTKQALAMMKANDRGKIMKADLVRANSVVKRIQMLQERGFPKKTIPSRYGGTFDMDKLHGDFIRMRISVEDFVTPMLVLGLKPTELERFRHLNDGYHVRKRRKKQLTLQDVQRQVKAEKERKMQLLIAQKSLEDSLALAKDIAALHDEDLRGVALPATADTTRDIAAFDSESLTCLNFATTQDTTREILALDDEGSSPCLALPPTDTTASRHEDMEYLSFH